MNLGLHMVRSWGIAVVPACCVEGAGLFRLNPDHPCLVSTWGRGAKRSLHIFFPHQLFYPTWPRASELQVSLKLRLLFPRVTSNSRDSLGANATLLVYVAGCTPHCVCTSGCRGKPWQSWPALAAQFPAKICASLPGAAGCWDNLWGAGRK